MSWSTAGRSGARGYGSYRDEDSAERYPFKDDCRDYKATREHRRKERREAYFEDVPRSANYFRAEDQPRRYEDDYGRRYASERSAQAGDQPRRYDDGYGRHHTSERSAEAEAQPRRYDDGYSRRDRPERSRTEGFSKPEYSYRPSSRTYTFRDEDYGNSTRYEAESPSPTRGRFSKERARRYSTESDDEKDGPYPVPKDSFEDLRGYSHYETESPSPDRGHFSKGRARRYSARSEHDNFEYSFQDLGGEADEPPFDPP